MKKILLTVFIICSILNPVRAQEKVDFNETTTKTIDGKEYIFYKNKAFTGFVSNIDVKTVPPTISNFSVKDGLKHGPFITTNSSGNPIIKNYANGILEGKYEEYYLNGQLKRKGNYLNGKLDEEQLNYWKTGQLKYKTTYLLGKKIGFEYYGLDGKLLSKHTTDESGKGTLTDFRDNQTYKTITFTNFLGKQSTWMAQNLNYKTESSVSYETNKKLRKKFPDMEDVGMGYNWADAKEACPIGWYLPNGYDWQVLIQHLGGKTAAANALKSTKYWHKDANGTNSSGFNALPIGGFSSKGKHAGFLGKGVHYWSSLSMGVYTALGYLLRYDYTDIMRFTKFYKIQPTPCRCVMVNPD